MYKYFLAAVTMITMISCDHVNADLIVGFGPSQANSGAGNYAFPMTVTNNTPAAVTITSFNFPLDVGGDGDFPIDGTDNGFSFLSFSAAAPNGDGQFSSTSSPLGTFYDVLPGGTATGGDTGLVLAVGETKNLFSITLTSDGSNAGNVAAASIITSGTGAGFGQLIANGTNVFATDLSVAGDASLTAIPEPSSFILLGLLGVPILVRRTSGLIRRIWHA